MNNRSTLSAVLWVANLVALVGVCIIDRNLKLEKARAEQRLANPGVTIDLNGDEPLDIDYSKKDIPEFSIYQV